MEKFFILTMTEGAFGSALNEEVIKAADRLDEVYVLETNVLIFEITKDEV